MLGLDEIRKIATIAMFSDDELMEMLVLKGGNAIGYFYESYSRASLDLDFSISGDFAEEDLESIKERVHKNIKTAFSEKGIVLYDYKFSKKPRVTKVNVDDFWGGYEIEFKLIEKDKYKKISNDIEAMRRESIVVGPSQQKKFNIDISKHEYCSKKLDQEVDGYTIFLYSPEMIVIEKLRAICQQIPEYPYGNKTARARDFIDIYLLIDHLNINLATTENMTLLKDIFGAKKVPLKYLVKVKEFRDFHERDFPSVVDTMSPGTKLEKFNFYFDYVLDTIDKLKVLWEE